MRCVDWPRRSAASFFLPWDHQREEAVRGAAGGERASGFIPRASWIRTEGCVCGVQAP